MSPSASVFGSPVVLHALLALGHGPAPSGGDAIPIRVEFDAPAGCASVDAFYAGVLARSDRARRAAPGDEAVRLGVRLKRSKGRVHGELRVLDGRAGEEDVRRVDGVRCDEVVEVLSLTAALVLDPGANLGAPAAVKPAPSLLSPAAPAQAPGPAPAPAPGTPAPAPPPAVSPAPSPPPPPASVPSPPPAPNARAPETTRPGAVAPVTATTNGDGTAAAHPLGVELGVGALASEIVSPALGGAISVRLRRTVPEGSGPSLGLAGVYLSSRLAGTPELETNFVAAVLTACPGWSVGATFVLEPCAQAVGGRLAATDRAVTNPRAVGRIWGTAGLLARATLRVGGGFSLEAEAGAGVSLVERRFITTTPERTVGQTPAIAATVGVGIARGL